MAYEFTHRGVGIKVSHEGRFHATLDEDQIWAESLVEIKKMIDRRKTRRRKLNVPCVLAILKESPAAYDLEGRASIVTGPGFFRGFNLHTRDVKVRFDDGTQDYESHGRWSREDRIYALPRLSAEVQTAELLELKQAVAAYNTAMVALKKQLDHFDQYNVDLCSGDKEQAITIEREQAERLQPREEES